MASAHSVMHPDLAALLTEFAAIRADAEKLVGGLTEDQFNWRPAAGKWSIAQCITHLNIVDGLDLPALASEIDEARKKGMTSSGPFRYGGLSTWFIRSMEPPPTRWFRASAPKVYTPPEAQSLSAAMDAFRRVQARVVVLVTSADGLDLARVKVGTPMNKRIKFSLGQRFRLIAAHDRRHLYQAWTVRRALP